MGEANMGIEIYLDIETSWSRDLTVVGVLSKDTGLIQLVGEEITRYRLLAELPRTGRLYTYNGHCFDLSEIRKQLGLNLRDQFDSFDLRWVCQRLGLTGGQKAVEKRVGFRRHREDIDGIEAMNLWEDYQSGDDEALKLLLAYNAEDLVGIRAIKRYLEGRGHL